MRRHHEDSVLRTGWARAKGAHAPVNLESGTAQDSHGQGPPSAPPHMHAPQAGNPSKQLGLGA